MKTDAQVTGTHVLTMVFEGILPHLALAEQVVYLRLCYLTHFQGTDYVSLRYDDLARTCHLSVSALQNTLKGLRSKKLITTTWRQKAPTLFHVHIVPLTPKKPKTTLHTLAIYDRFTDDERTLFLTAKRSLPPSQVEALEKEATDWLSDRFADYPPSFLRDKLDELILHRTFGPDRAKKYEPLFLHLYQYK